MKMTTFCALAFFVLTTSIVSANASAQRGAPASQAGTVLSGDEPVSHAKVRLYRAGHNVKGAHLLGEAMADENGKFKIHYRSLADKDSVLYLIADGRRHQRDLSSVRLAAVFDQKTLSADVVVNERTTVAMAFATAQFTNGQQLGGKNPGLKNAVAIAQNLVDLSTGDIASVLAMLPNGTNTSTMSTLNSLANMLAACVQDEGQCPALFIAARPMRGPAPRDTLQAAVTIAQNPAQNPGALFQVSTLSPVYQPALQADQAPDAWILVLLYDADGRMDGPGNFALDRFGNAWVNNNYVYSANTNPNPPVCGNTKVYKLAPDGNNVPGSPFGGVDGSGENAGGLYGAGYGIALDPDESAWVTSFGFKGQSCDQDASALAVSVAKFSAAGDTLSTPDGDPFAVPAQPGGFGYDGAGNMSQPQGVISDRQGNIWIANCVNSSVTRFPRGDPDKVENYPFPESELDRPFDVATDHRGHAWVTGNNSNNVLELNRKGEKIQIITDDGLDVSLN